ncbi:MAG TPA: DUF4932 domain-containing protein [Aridibacter sp.]|nr:DUF4932 domain-containing protein [Aridibacter sp.]
MNKFLPAVLTILLSVHLLALEPPNVIDRTSSNSGSVDKEREMATGVSVDVDPRIELMSVLQVLTGYMLVTRDDSDYKQEVLQSFSSYSEHRAVKMYAEMSARGFAFDVVPKLFISLTKPPDLELRVSPSEQVITSAGGKEAVDEFIAALNEFVDKSKFVKFFKRNRSVYGRVVESNKANILSSIKGLNEYVGVKQRNSHVVLGMLLHDGGFAASFYEKGEFHAYSFIGPAGTKDGLADFGEPQRISRLVSHEFSHTVVNRLTAENMSEITRFSSLLDPIAEKMAKQAYPTWEIVVNEHIVRAVTLRLILKAEGEESFNAALEKEEQRGFKYVRPITEKLEKYEVNREKYPVLGDFYPEFINVLRKIKSVSEDIEETD